MNTEKPAFEYPALLINHYQKQYYLLLEENKMLQEECAALREHINEISN